MKKNRLAAGALALAVSLAACGCGDEVYELTEEEESVIVHYSSHAVTKFNKKQSEGIRNVAALEAQMAAALEEEKNKQEEEQEPETTADDKKEDQQQPQTDQANPSDTPQETQKTYVSLNQALQLGGIDAIYKNYKIASVYKETESYIVSAGSGNDLLVLTVNLKNNGSKAAKCDILSKMPSFRLTVNGELSVSADTTILLNDLGTYQGRIKAGGTKKTVLIFQVQHGAVKKIDSMELEVTIGDTSSEVLLIGN